MSEDLKHDRNSRGGGCFWNFKNINTQFYTNCTRIYTLIKINGKVEVIECHLHLKGGTK